MVWGQRILLGMGKLLLRFLTLTLKLPFHRLKLLLIVELGLIESKRCVPLEFQKLLNSLLIASTWPTRNMDYWSTGSALKEVTESRSAATGFSYVCAITSQGEVNYPPCPPHSPLVGLPYLSY
uniref:Uncharacterized protein n=1 Tax=Nelumbo nucifera TaxID=4432 RepID=A0A822Y0Z6_NELNU|nr:TPA_asm: hypothetical protein HUJ06_026978 [Nelumbo nucifera]DAD25673.1 TPA_asm: hypothetical protein HUJ06_027137 [Nelumbo nucifera]